MSEFLPLIRNAFSAYKKGDLEQALSTVQRAESLFSPSNGVLSKEDFYLFKGTVLYGLDRADESRPAFETALESNHTSVEASVGLARCLRRLGEYDNALIMYGVALQLDPSNTALREEADEAEEEANRITEPVAEAEPTRLVSALECFFNKQYTEALELLEPEVENKREELASMENVRGFSFLALRKNDEAEKAFQEAILLNPRSSQGYAGLGEVSYLAGNDTLALEYYEKAVGLNEQNEFAKAGLEKVRTSFNLAKVAL